MVSPVIDSSHDGNGGTISGTSKSWGTAVQTSGTNRVFLAIVGYNQSSTQYAAGVAAVSSIAESSSTLSLSKAYSIKNDNSGDGSHYVIEIWQAQAAAQFNSAGASLTWTVNWSHTVDCANIIWTSYSGVYSLSNPWDSNVGAPFFAANSTSTTPPTTTYSTTQADDMLLWVGGSGTSYTVDGGPSGSWNRISDQSANGSQTGGCSLTNSYLSVSAAQTSQTVAGSSGSNQYWLGGVVALTADATASTETGTGILAFGPVAMAGAGMDPGKGTGILAFGPVAMAGAGMDPGKGTGILAFGPVAMAGAGIGPGEGTGILAFGPVAISGASTFVITASRPYGPHLSEMVALVAYNPPPTQYARNAQQIALIARRASL